MRHASLILAALCLFLPASPGSVEAQQPYSPEVVRADD